MDFDGVVEQYHVTLREFAKGNPEPVKALLSHNGDVSLAGGFGGITRGWEQVTKNIDFAASKFKGQISFENVAKYATQDLGYIVEIEHYSTADFSPSLRVTSIFRREDRVWKLVHRHGDPTTAMLALIQAVPKTVVSIKQAE